MMKQSILLLLIVTLFLPCNAQKNNTGTFQQINDSLSVRLSGNTDSTLHFRCYLTFTNRYLKDSITVVADSLPMHSCALPRSVFFVNRNTGFLVVSGGCYMVVYNLLKTTDGGKTWKEIMPIPEQEVGRKYFYMFNEKKGILIIQNPNGTFDYKLSYDGGESWQRYAVKFGFFEDRIELSDVFFSQNGQVTVVFQTKDIKNNADYGKVYIWRSNDFGKTFSEMK